MNTRELLRQLSDYLQCYGHYNFHFHREFAKELITLVTKHVNTHDSFLKQLVTAFNNIRHFTHNIHDVDNHEKLKRCPFYSIHLQTREYNFRFLISFNNKDEPIFLTAFYERAGKKQTNYDKPIETAQNRLKDIINGGN